MGSSNRKVCTRFAGGTGVGVRFQDHRESIWGQIDKAGLRKEHIRTTGQAGSSDGHSAAATTPVLGAARGVGSRRADPGACPCHFRCKACTFLNTVEDTPRCSVTAGSLGAS